MQMSANNYEKVLENYWLTHTHIYIYIYIYIYNKPTIRKRQVA